MPARVPYHLQYLKAELRRRKREQGHYSLRAFAESLELDTGALSRVMNGRQELSLNAARSVIERLGLTGEDRRAFVSSVALDKLRRTNEALAEALGGTDPRLDTSGLPFPLHTLISAADDAYMVWDADHRLLYVNPAGEALLGKTRAELLGRSIHELGFEREHLNEAIEHQQEVLSSGLPVAREARVEQNGKARWFHRLIAPIRAANDDVQAIVSVLRDITPMKVAGLRSAHLQQMTALLSEDLDRDGVLRVVLDRLRSTVGASRVSIFLASEDRSELVLVGVSPRMENHRFPKVALNGSRKLPSVDVFLTGQPAWFPRLEDAQGEFPHLNEVVFEGARSGAVLPLSVNDEVRGAVALRFDEPRALDAGERAFLLTVVDLCAQALERARLRASERECRVKAEEQESRYHFLYDATLRLGASLDLKEVVRTLEALLVPRFADRFELHLLEADGSVRRAFAEERASPRERDETERAGRAIRAGSMELPNEPEGSETLLVPLLQGGFAFGAISLGMLGSGRRILSRDAETIEDLARQASQAIANARAYRRATRPQDGATAHP